VAVKGDSAVLHLLDGDEASIEFSDRGEGQPVLLLHAGVFADWFPALVEQPRLNGFRLVTPVRAGYDSTRPAPAHHLTLADHARHAAAVLDDLGIAQAHVLGHSAGSLIGLQLAVDRPELVRGLVLVEPAAAPSLLPPTVPQGLRGPVDAIAATAAAGDLDKWCRGLRPASTPRPGRMPVPSERGSPRR
jgi:pimeloyl-ACP methyl ester carboxylesterase